MGRLRRLFCYGEDVPGNSREVGIVGVFLEIRKISCEILRSLGEGEEKGGSESRIMTSMGEGEGDSNEGEGEGESSKIRVDGVAGRDIGSDEIGVGDPEEGQKKARTEGVQQEEKGWSGEKTRE